MRRQIWLAVLAAASILVAAPARAQDTGNRGNGMNGAKQARQGLKARTMTVLASSILDHPIQGNDTGKSPVVKDAVVDSIHGKIPYLVLSWPGKDQLKAIPISQCRFEVVTSKNLDLRIDLVGDVSNAATFTREQWNDATERRGIYGKLQANAEGAHSGHPMGMGMPGKKGMMPGKGGGTATMNAAYYRLADFLDFGVQNANDKTIGDVSDLTFETRNGKIRSVLVHSGGFIGIGESTRLVPWKMTSVRRSGDSTIVEVQPPAGGKMDDRGRMPMGAKDAPPANTRFTVNLKRGTTCRYRLEIPTGSADVLGWEEKEGNTAKPPSGSPGAGAEGMHHEIDRWTGECRIDVQNVDEDGTAHLAVTITPNASGSNPASAHYTATVTTDGTVKNVVKTDANGKEMSGSLLQTDRIQSTLRIICGAGLAGKSLAPNEPVDLPNEVSGPIRNLVAQSGSGTSGAPAPASSDRKVTCELNESQPSNRKVEVEVRVAKDRVGHAAFSRNTGLLDEFVVQPKGSERASLVIRSANASGGSGGNPARPGDRGPRKMR